MLSYWILRDETDAPIGLVRVEDDRVTLQPTAAISCDWRLFSETDDVPAAPFTAVRLAGAAALLGTKDGKLAAFAAAPDAKPAAAYLGRLSRIRTIEEPAKPVEPPMEALESQDDAEEEPTPLPDVSDTARDTEAFSQLLRCAEAFYARFADDRPPIVDNLVQKEDNPEPRTGGINLFPQAFPGARWRYVQAKDLLAHYEGEYREPGGERVRILAVRGKRAPCPPRTLRGFTRYLRAFDGTGYWIRILPMD